MKIYSGRLQLQMWHYIFIQFLVLYFSFLSHHLFFIYILLQFQLILCSFRISQILSQIINLIQIKLMSAQAPNPNSRLPSIVPKRDIMWNIIQPGDPYDIRKSMIAKLPGRKKFMGEHLELVCLFQAAQIERLCQYLEQHKLKLREVERRELDRHSYEIQIKQLTQRISDESSLKAENLKLRDFLRKQTVEFEDLRKRLATSGNEDELLRRYEDSLHQIEIVMNENEELKQTFMRMRSEYEQAVAAKNAQIDDLQRRLKEPTQLSRSESFYKIQVQSKKLQFENRRLKQIGQARSKELQEVQGKCKQLVYQIQEQNTQIRQYSHLSSTIKEYESRFSMLGEEIDRLNSVLRDKTAEGRQLANRYRALQQEKRQQISYINQLQGRKTQLQEYNRRLQFSIKDSGSGIDESRTIIRTYETNLEKLSLEVQRLNKVLRMKMGQLQQCERRNSELQQELRRNDNVKKQIQDFRAKFSELNRKMAEYQNRIVISAQQIQRLNQVLKRKNYEVQSLQAQLKLRNGQLQNAHNQYYHLQIEYKSQINYISNNYQAKIAQLQQTLQARPRQSQTQLFDMREEIQRLNSIVLIKNGEIQQLRKSTTIGQGIRPQVDNQLYTVKSDNYNLRSNLDQYQSRILMLSQQIQRLNTVIRNSSPSLSPSRKPEQQPDTRKLTQYENKIAILSQEIDRLNDNLRTRDSKIKNYEQQLQKYRKISQTDNQQALKAETQVKINAMSGQIDRLTQTLRRKEQQIQTLQQKLRSQTTNQYQIDAYKHRIEEQEKLISDLDAFSREIDSKFRAADQQSRIFQQQIKSFQQMQANKAQGARQLYEYESKIVALSQQIQRLNKVLQRFNNENQDLKRKLYEAQQLKDAINALEERFAFAARQNENLKKSINQGYQTINKTSQQYDFKIKQITVEKDQLIRKTQEQDFAIQGLQRDLQYNHSLTKAKNDELLTLDGRNRSIQSENELLKRKINELTPLLDRIAQYDSRLAMFSQQIDRLNNNLRSKTEEITILDNRCHGYENQLNKYQRKVGQLENNITRQLESKNASLFKENQELRARIKQLVSESARFNEFQNKLALTLGQVQRLNNLLKLKIEDIDHISNKLRANEQQLQKSKRRNEQLQSTIHRQLKNQSVVFEQHISQLLAQNQAIRKSLRQLSDANRIIPELQNKLAVASSQVQRLNGILHKVNKEVVPSLQQKAKRMTAQFEEYRQRCFQLGESNKQGLQAAARLKLLTQQNEQSLHKIQEYEGKIGTLSAEIDRLNGVLRKKLEQLNNFESKFRLAQNEYDQLSKRYKETSQISKRIPQYQSKIALLGQQLQRINGILRSKSEELASSQSKIRMLQHDVESSLRRVSQHQSTIIEHKRLRATLEQRLTGAGSENEELRRSIRDLADSNRKIIQYQSKLTLFSQEVQRLNLNLRAKTDELASIQNNMRNMKRQAEVKIISISSQLQEQRRKTSQNIGTQASRLAEYENKMLIMSKQIQRLNIVLKETTFQLQGSKGREKQCLQQIQRLNNTLRIKVQQTTRWQQANNQLKLKLRSAEQSLSNVNSQLQKLRQQHIQLTEQYKKSNQHMVQYEQSINKLYQQFQRLQNIIQNLKKQNYDLKLNLQEAGNLVEKNRHLSTEIDRLLQVIEQQTADLQELRLALADQSALQKRISEYMALMVVLFAQIQSLRIRVKDTEKQIKDVRRSSLAPFKV